MKLLRLCLASGLLMAGVFSVSAQQPSTIMDANNVRVEILQNGQLFTDGLAGKFIPLEPGLAEQTLLGSSGLWIVGRNPLGQFSGTVQTSLQTDLSPGLLLGNTASDSVTGIWSVNCSDIRAHSDDYADNGVLDEVHPAVFAWPSHGNALFPTYNSGMVLPQSEQNIAGYAEAGPTYGTFEAQEGDAPAIEIRGCALVPSTADQMVWHAVNDKGVAHPSGLVPQGFDVQTAVFAFATEEQSANKTIFVRHKIINRGLTTLADAHFGVFADFSVGNPSDDYAGSDPTQQLLFAYNGDNQDENGFGAEIPAVGMRLLRGPLDVDSLGEAFYPPVAKYMIVNEVENMQTPGYYRILHGLFANGAPAPNNGMMYAGNPNEPGSNSEIAAGSVPGKRYGVISYGPITLLPGAVNEIIIAYSYAYAPGNTPAQNAQLLIENAAGSKALFDDCFLHSGNACSFTSPVSEPARQLFRIYPNPGHSVMNIETEGLRFNEIRVSNVLGQMVKTLQLEESGTNATLPVEDLPNGVYQVHIGAQTQMIVVQH